MPRKCFLDIKTDFFSLPQEDSFLMQENNIFCQEKIFLRHEQKLNWFVTLSRKKIEPENSCE